MLFKEEYIVYSCNCKELEFCVSGGLKRKDSEI